MIKFSSKGKNTSIYHDFGNQDAKYSNGSVFTMLIREL